MKQRLARFLRSLSGPFPALAERFDNSLIVHMDDLLLFVGSRASYIAQTSLYGYLKTRMGTSFRVVFEDPQFSAVIHMATVRLFSACAADLACFSAYWIFNNTHQTSQAQALALLLFDRALEHELSDDSRAHIETDIRQRLVQRLHHYPWGNHHCVAHFHWSEADIVRHAPILDAYKELDAEIVQNSIRFRWIDVIDQVKRRYAPTELRLNLKKLIEQCNEFSST